ncbi:MAG: flagellar biosynthesis protein FlhB [Lachnospiraceae bacterium]|nr:flagellar biosynthesis protein FlhB [Lachnospiraceae bacterium]
MEVKYNKNLILEYNLQWFGGDGDGGEKTEPATQKKLDDARKEGKVAKSKDVTEALQLVVLFLALKIFMSYVGEHLIGVFTVVLGNMADFVKVNRAGLSTIAVGGYLINMIVEWMLIVLPFFLFGFVITFLVTVYQVGWTVSLKPLEPKLSKFNPISGFKRIISKDSLFELLKSIVKIIVIVYIAYSTIKDDANSLFVLYEIELNQAIALVGEIILDVGLRIAIVYIVVGAVDYFYQRHKFAEEMKMTKQEVKDEYKNTEGDPQVKGQQRSRMREASQRRMMQDVPQADVVITNPTHFAVAIKYDADAHAAPVVLAKGADYVAAKIKEIAKENKVEIVENKPLARMLYHNVDIGAEIPPELYQSVAEVLAMVYHMKNP